MSRYPVIRRGLLPASRAVEVLDPVEVVSSVPLVPAVGCTNDQEALTRAVQNYVPGEEEVRVLAGQMLQTGSSEGSLRKRGPVSLREPGVVFDRTDRSVHGDVELTIKLKR